MTFVPIGSGVLILKDPEQCRFVAKTASYIIRKGSMNPGRFTLEGSSRSLSGSVARATSRSLWMHAHVHAALGGPEGRIHE